MKTAPQNVKRIVKKLMLSVIVNCAAVVLGSGVGLLLKKGIPEKVSNAIMYGLGLCVLYIGISGAFEGENVLIAILSMALGTILGEALDLDGRLNSLGKRLEDRFSKAGTEKNIAKGFVSASLLFCVGAMSVVGSLQSGLTGNHETIFAKSLIDGIAAIVLTSPLGVGVMFSAVFVFLYQGAIVLGASLLQYVLTDAVVAEMTCVGSLLIVGLALNMLNITRLKVMNYLPAMFMPIAIIWIIELFKGGF